MKTAILKLMLLVLASGGLVSARAATEAATPASAKPTELATVKPDATAWAIPTQKADFHVFILMGQSNMAGHGGIAPGDPYLPGDKDPVPHILVLDGQGTNADPRPREPIAWRPGAHRLHLRMDSEQFGLGMDFAKEYLKTHPGVTVGLIPCAWGGAEINGLKKGTPIYANAMMRVAEARKIGTLKGVLWHQGESDSVNAELAKAYEGKLRQLIADLRSDCGDPNLPFLIGNLAEFYGTCVADNHNARLPLINQVRGALYRVGTETPNAAFVASTGLVPDDGHFVHFNRASYIEFGQRYARALAELEAKNQRR